jgi:hypothetical protein
MRVLICLLLFVSASAARGQFRFTQTRDIPVNVAGQPLTRAWEGGINAAQYQKMDLNNDGVEDLVIYHRISGELTPYLSDNNSFVFAPEYKYFFPEEVSDWLILADYNCDGRKDIFTSTPFGIKVFENVSTGNTPAWTEAVDFITFDNDINLQVNASDIPGIADIDGDGDLDILAYRFSTSNTIDYYKNLSIENTGSCGTLTFTRDNRRWGDMEECDCNSFAFGTTCAAGGTANSTNDLLAPEAAEHAGGKTILLLDRDNDGDMDLITSDEFCETLYYMENKGTVETARMEGFTALTESDPVGSYFFPSAFFVDLNFDNEKDLIISTNADNNIGNQIDFSATSNLILNTGSTTEPVLTGAPTVFLQDQMIDLGETTYPAIADIDSDGDLDLLVGTKGMLISGVLTASIYLFENTGTRFNPEFELVNDDYLGLRAAGYRNIKPQFVDLDADGDPDLSYQATTISGNQTALRYRLNQGDFSFGNEGEIGLTVRENEQYHFSDIDKDGAPDLLISNRLGSLSLYINQGNLTFGEGTDDFGGFTNGFDNLNTSVHLADLNNDGQEELITTDITGRLEVFTGQVRPEYVPEQRFTDIFQSPISTALLSSRLDELAPFTSADLFGTGKPALIIGNNRGGLYIMRNESITGGEPSARRIQLIAFPNPVSDKLYLQTDTDGVLDIYTINGQRIQQDIEINSASQLEVVTSDLPAGIYIFRVRNGLNQPGTQKVIITH